jgi:FkbM family methyltransferase
VDVGANIGIHACVGAAQLTDGGRLVAFEPVPGNAEVLRRNLDQNGLSDRVRVEELAVGESAGEVTIHLAPTSGNHSLAAGVVAHSRATIPVRVTSLDEYLAGTGGPVRVDVLKIDVEGYDGFALRGAATLLREQQPTLMVEFVPSHLANAGFRPADFLEIVFAAYPEVYVIDEPRRRLDRCSRDELARYGEKSRNLNLVAVADPAHLKIIEEYRTTLH